MLGIAARAGRAVSACLDFDAFMVASEHDVDRTTDRVPAVQGGGAVAQDFDALHGRYWQGVEIEGRVGDAAPVDENRGPAASENERPVEAPTVVFQPAQQQVPHIFHAGQLDFAPFDHCEGRCRARRAGRDVAGYRQLASGHFFLRPGIGRCRNDYQGGGRKEYRTGAAFADQQSRKLSK